MIVVDAGVVVDFLLGRPSAMQALEEALNGREQEPLCAPELIEPEVLNVLRRLAQRGDIDRRQADDAVTDLEDLRMMRFPHAPLRRRVWALRDELTAYDATYLALAEALDGSLLLTTDTGMAARATASLGADRVRRVG